jgi:hypothetical protein
MPSTVQQAVRRFLNYPSATILHATDWMEKETASRTHPALLVETGAFLGQPLRSIIRSIRSNDDLPASTHRARRALRAIPRQACVQERGLRR